MSAALLALTAVLSYLVGAVPFGYLVARRFRGIDVRQHGSGNIGATNVGRAVGPHWGVLVFFLDFAKGAVPVLLAGLLAPALPEGVEPLPNALAVTAGIAAFLGHLFPIWLRFRGGKGVATGAGVALVLVPWLTLGAAAAWAVVLALTRTMSLASLTAAGVLCGLRLALTAQPWSDDKVVVTAFCLAGAVLIFLRHAGNIRRLWQGTEHRL